MIVFAWLLVSAWALALLASARTVLRGLPEPTHELPPFALWLPHGGEAPALVPAPARVFTGPLPDDGPDRLLVLGAAVTVDPSLPGRLAACGADFVSVFARPSHIGFGDAVERFWRDFSGAEKVLDPLHPAGFADARCAWIRRRDLALDGVGEEPILRAARARKAHGLPVELREGVSIEGPPWRPLVSAPPRSFQTHRAEVPDLVSPEPVVRPFIIWFPLLLNVAPLLLCVWPSTRTVALLALALGAATRLMTALREGFGYHLVITGWLLDPILAMVTLSAPRRAPDTPFPTLPKSRPPQLTAAVERDGRAWLDTAAVPFLARRLGGSGMVMEQIYLNEGVGSSAFGRFVDRVVQRTPSARAVRNRLIRTVEVGRRLRPDSVLSVPCGSARDVAAIAPKNATLVDPDLTSRRLAAARCPSAEVVSGTVERAPVGPFELILYIGLAEYLDDTEVVHHLTALRARLAPEGSLLVSCTSEHSERARMSTWLGWKTKARSSEAFVRLLDLAGLAVAGQWSDPADVQWVFLARPRVPEREGSLDGNLMNGPDLRA